MTGKGGGAISIDELIERGASSTDADWAAALRVGHARRHLHLHLHVGDDRPAEGLRHLPRQLPRDARHGRREERPRRRRRAHVPLPATRPLVRAADPVRQLRARRFDRLLGARSAADRAEPHRGQAHLLPVGAADLREDLHRRDRGRREGGRRQEEDLRLVDRRRQALPRGGARRRRRARSSRPAQASPTASSCRRSATSSAATCASPSLAPRRSTPTSCASSTPPACSSSRAGA